MKLSRFTALAILALSVAGCANVETVTRNATAPAGLEAPAFAAQIQRNYNVQDIRVSFPADLTISEANSYYPIADIVWRGDPLGDRRQQIAEIFTTSFRNGTANMSGDMPVVVAIDIVRFHSLTERTRYTIGGVHSIRFGMTVLHAETGQVVEARRVIDGDLAALGGQAAVMAEARGEGQKVRITRHLTMLANSELGPNPAI